jgi:hypothetical protein
MRLAFTTSSLVALALAATLGVAGPAQAGCTLSVNSDANSNTCIGEGALGRNVTTGDNQGNYNAAIGRGALANNTNGSNNTASGAFSLYKNSTGSQNTAYGEQALLANTTGLGNTGSGFQVLQNNTTGSYNTALGYQAGIGLTTGSYNIVIGSQGVKGDSATIRIGTKGVQTRAFMAGIRGVNVKGGQTVLVNKDGQLGVASSSRRYKQDIQPMGDASDKLMQLQPVTFHYKQADENGERPLQYGLIAEDVAAVMPALAIYNDQGAPESVAYQMLPTLLLNEYQKQARELADVKAELATLRLAVSRLTAAPSATQLASGN